ncbi:MAG: alpha amylase C-terminal domain-containing protein [Paludibacteraceae bacterium]|nr:alpha amylase C-terminal domain-containing protein [Paludibacteraceae bacterium]
METLKIIRNDEYLKPYAEVITDRYLYAVNKEKNLIQGLKNLSEFASGHLYFGLHKLPQGWVIREWAPNATAIYLKGTFNDWQKLETFRFVNIGNGVWELNLPGNALQHGDLYKLQMEWEGGCGERVPAWARRVVQDDVTKIFSAQVWAPDKPYQFKIDKFKPNTDPLLIYECHIGMATEEEKVGTYREFTQNVLPRVKKAGYNCIQIMAIQEHPYYGSFGYHVSSFFAASSRFGTPDELKELVDTAHEMGLAVIMDLVHSHAVKNEVEGLGRYDGTPYQFFHGGWRREHVAWDSLCFDYGKNEVLHFLLSNCKFWLEEYKFDGFRFDGVTSMLYLNHGLGTDFMGYGDYYNMNEDNDAICYLTLANKLIHEIRPKAITIAEEMSGMPGLAAPFKDGGMGFDYRLAMGIPDFWIKMIKEQPDEYWKPGHIFWELTNHRADEKTINYAESHDQALVGDKTIIFRLIDAEMYTNMSKLFPSTYMVDRGIALHKMIRLITASTMSGGYLNFMGNEFGHPEWIDFPREGNGWSYKYARRQWHLLDDHDLRYQGLGDFDRELMELISAENKFQKLKIEKLWDSEGDQFLAFRRGDLVFVFNFHPSKSYSDYGFLTERGSYKVVLNTDDKKFGGFGLVDDEVTHFTIPDVLYRKVKKEWLKIYIPSRCAMVLKKMD